MAYVKVGKDKCACYQTNRGAVIAQLPYGQRDRYVSSFSAKERANNPHAFAGGSKTLRDDWLRRVPRRKRWSDQRQVYDEKTGGTRESTLEEEKIMARVNALEGELQSDKDLREKDAGYWDEIKRLLDEDPRKDSRSPLLEHSDWSRINFLYHGRYLQWKLRNKGAGPSLLPPPLPPSLSRPETESEGRLSKCEAKLRAQEGEFKRYSSNLEEISTRAYMIFEKTESELKETRKKLRETEIKLRETENMLKEYKAREEEYAQLLEHQIGQGGSIPLDEPPGGPPLLRTSSSTQKRNTYKLRARRTK